MTYQIGRPSNELALLLASLGDPVGKRILSANFYFLIKKTCGDFYIQASEACIEYNDLFLTAQNAVNTAAETYSFGEVPFHAYLLIVLNRAVWSLIRAQLGPTNTMFNNAISFDEKVSQDNPLTISDSVGEDDIYRSKVYTKSMVEHIDQVISKRFSNDELIVIKGRLHGYSYKEIAKMNRWRRRKLDEVIATLRQKYEIT